MVNLISSNVKEYNNGTVKIGQNTYGNVSNVDTRTYIDNDNKVKSVSYIDAKNAEYTAYVEDGNVVVSKKYYRKPVSKNIGGKEYKGIQSSTFYPDGTKVYETLNRRGIGINTNTIKVTPEGNVIDYAAESRKQMIDTLSKPLKKIVNIFGKIRA